MKTDVMAGLRNFGRTMAKGTAAQQACSTCAGSGRVRVKGSSGPARCEACEGSGQRGGAAKSSSAESDSIQLAVSGEGDGALERHPVTGRFTPRAVKKTITIHGVSRAPEPMKGAIKVLQNPSSNGDERMVAEQLIEAYASKQGNSGDMGVQDLKSADASDVGVVGGEINPEYVSKMRKAIASPAVGGAQKEELGQRLTKALLTESHMPAGSVAKSSLTVADPPPIARLRQLVLDPNLDPALKSEVSALLTRNDLAKAASEEQAQRVNSALAATSQAQATIDAIRGYQAANVQQGQQPVAGSSSEGQVRTIGSGAGTPQSLGAAMSTGNRGDLSGSQGKIESEPAAQILALEDELAKSSNEIDRQRIGEVLTFMRLREAAAARLPQPGSLVAA